MDSFYNENQRVDNTMYDPNQQYYNGVDVVATPQMQYVPNQDYLNNYADYYGNIQPDLAWTYKDLANQAGIWWDTQRNILNWYDTLANDVANRQNNVMNMSWNLANDLIGDINNQRDYIYSLYWPEWSITQQVNDYYSWLVNSLAWDTWRQLAQNDVNAAEIGMSTWANRNAQNDIYNQWYQRSLQAMEQDINAKNQIVQQLQTYLTQFRQEYGDTTDKYLIQQYQKGVDLLNQVQSWLTEQMAWLETARLQNAIAKMSSNSQNTKTTLTSEELSALQSYLINLAGSRSSEDFYNDKNTQSFLKYYQEQTWKPMVNLYDNLRNNINNNISQNVSWFKLPNISNGYTGTFSDVMGTQWLSQLDDGSWAWDYKPFDIEVKKE